jgi:hypothetical protein
MKKLRKINKKVSSPKATCAGANYDIFEFRLLHFTDIFDLRL